MIRQRVLLTGATGFIGQRLQSALLENGRSVAAIVRESSPNRSRLLPACEVITSGFSQADRLVSACTDAGAIIYCAGSVRGRNLDDFMPANVDGVARLVQALNRCGSRIPFLLISSLAASRPEISDYARSKYLGEQELRMNARFPWTIFRPPAVYGPGDREMLPILKMAKRGFIVSLGPVNQRISLIHVDDLCLAAVTWLDNWRVCQGRLFTLDDGCPGGYDWQAIAESASDGRYRSLKLPRSFLFAIARINLTLAGLFDYAPMLTPGKVRELTQADWLCDNSDLTAATGWTPTIQLEEGVRKLFAKQSR